jgi:hypothetical protein
MIALLAAFLFRNRDFFAIDTCLDAGGGWDSASRTCIPGDRQYIIIPSERQ